jgi:hypothetical protein
MHVPATSDANVTRMNVIINYHHCCAASVPCHANKTKKGKYSKIIFKEKTFTKMKKSNKE